MRSTPVWAAIFVLAAAGFGMPAGAHAQGVSIGVQTNNMQLGINLGPTPPPLAVVPGPVAAVPGPPVYYAPSLPYNYFVYGNVYYLYREGRWFRARHYDGPWTGIAIDRVPRPILAVPVERYRERPERWAHHGPPPWAHERDRERQWEYEHGRGHDRGEAHHDGGYGRHRG
jgi:hypothetical protein